MPICWNQSTTVPTVRKKIAMDAVNEHFLSIRDQRGLSNTCLTREKDEK